MESEIKQDQEPQEQAGESAAAEGTKERPAERPVERPAAYPAAQQRETGGGQGSRPWRRGRGRRRPCVMCVEKMTHVDYKEIGFLRRFVSDRGRIETRRKTGTCAKHQRALAQAIKRARHLALLPYTAGHIRTGVTPVR